jgi:hypothetical protein
MNIPILNIEEIRKKAELASNSLTEAQLKEKAGRLSLMNARMIQGIFQDNRNNHLILGIINEIRKVHGLEPATAITNAVVESLSPVRSIFERNMTADLIGTGNKINVALEVQKEKQEDYAVRGTVSSSNQMKTNFEPGKNFGEAPDVFGINILGFNLPELESDKNFLSIITRVNKNTGEYFLEEKYSDYYICLPKMDKDRNKVLNNQKELWDICLAFKTEINKYSEVVKMIESPIAKELMSEASVLTQNPNAVREAMTIEEEQMLFERYVDSIIQKKDRLITQAEVRVTQAEVRVKKQIAINMLKSGMGSKEVSKILNIKLAVIEDLIKEHKLFNTEISNNTLRR